MQKEIKRRVRNYAVVAILLAVILGVLCYNLGFVPQIPFTTASTLRNFASEAELKSFLESNANRSQYVPLLEASGNLNTWIPTFQDGQSLFILSAEPFAVASIQGGSSSKNVFSVTYS